MNNAEYMRLLKAQRERAKMKESEVVEALKIEEPAEDDIPIEVDPEIDPVDDLVPPEPNKEVLTSSYGMEDAQNAT